MRCQLVKNGYRLPTFLMPGIKVRIREVNVFKTKVSHKSDMAGPFIRGDTNTLFFFSIKIIPVTTFKSL